MYQDLRTRFILPQPLTSIGPRGETWNLWKAEFLNYLNISGNFKYSSTLKTFILINLIGPVGYEAIHNISFDNDNDRTNIDIVLSKLDEYFNESKKEIEARYNFFTRQIKPGEDIDDYIQVLKVLAGFCNFGDEIDKMIYDRVIMNLNQFVRRAVFFQDETPTLSDIVQCYKQTYIQKNAVSIDNIRVVGNEPARARNDQEKPPPSEYCFRCGFYHHFIKNCPFLSHVCSLCRRVGHVSKQCQKENKSSNAMPTKRQALEDTSHLEAIPPFKQYKVEGSIKATSHKKKYCHNCGNHHTETFNCPARDKLCSCCLQYGHYTKLCKIKPDLKSDKDLPTKSKINVCIWCERRHRPTKHCEHEATCISCNRWPHRICFWCKRNPHLDTCPYIPVIVLPMLRRRDICSQCGNLHLANQCLETQSDLSSKQHIGDATQENNLYSELSKTEYFSLDHHKDEPFITSNNSNTTMGNDIICSDNIQDETMRSEPVGENIKSKKILPAREWEYFSNDEYKEGPIVLPDNGTRAKTTIKEKATDKAEPRNVLPVAQSESEDFTKLDRERFLNDEYNEGPFVIHHSSNNVPENYTSTPSASVIHAKTRIVTEIPEVVATRKTLPLSVTELADYPNKTFNESQLVISTHLSNATGNSRNNYITNQDQEVLLADLLTIPLIDSLASIPNFFDNSLPTESNIVSVDRLNSQSPLEDSAENEDLDSSRKCHCCVIL